MSTFAQKSELKAADKALKKKDYSGALSAISQAESLIANADAKNKAKFYFIKGMALYGNGSSYDVDAIAEALNEVMNIEKGKATSYSAKASQTLNNMAVKLKDEAYKNFKLANASLNADDYKKAANGYYDVYKLMATDTVSLYSSAYLNYFSKNYQKSIDHFQQLLDMNFNGSTTIYKATSIVNGEEVVYNSKKEMDNQVRLKFVENASVENTPSKVNDIIKYMALNYVGLGQNEKALTAIAKAREIAPDDFNLIINEANVYYEMGNNAKYTERVEEALAIEPNNAELHYNVGTLSMDIDVDKAEKHLLKAIELKPDYAEAYGNMGNLILKKIDAVQEEMDANAMNFAKYDQIKAEKMVPILKESLPYLEKSYELKPTDFAKTQLNSLYENLGMEKTVE
ncbi:MAG: hypothetical protein COA67_07425 [Lutibacter sp.]|nr:MAG: hypothetical protein COA67_07425 [Lutibacter sp.]